VDAVDVHAVDGVTDLVPTNSYQPLVLLARIHPLLSSIFVTFLL
jgi:hypothetical protein